MWGKAGDLPLWRAPPPARRTPPGTAAVGTTHHLHDASPSSGLEAIHKASPRPSVCLTEAHPPGCKLVADFPCRPQSAEVRCSDEGAGG